MLNFNSVDSNPYKQKINGNAGFTLLEVMVAMAIIAIVLVSVMRLQGQTISMNESSRFYTMAALLAQSKMAEIKADPAAGELESSGDFGNEYPGYAWQVTAEDVPVDVPGGPKFKLKRIDLMIKFNNDLKYTFTQYINPEAEASDATE